MKAGIWLGFSVGLLSLIVVMPGTLVTAYPGGSLGGPYGIDDWFTGAWTESQSHEDGTSTWLTGVWMGGLIYRDFSIPAPGDDYTSYVDEIMIPWIMITYNLNNVETEVIYPHDIPSSQGGTDDGHLMLYWSSFSEGNNGQNPNGVGSDLDAKYQLDVDSDGNFDFQFQEQISLDGAAAGGTITMRFAMLWCRGWVFQGLGNVVKITVPYMCEAYVCTPTNDIEEWIGGAWSEIDYEDGPVNVIVGGVACVRATNSDYPGRDIAMVPGVNNQLSGEYWCLNAEDNTEIGQYPDIYQDGENVVYAKVALWYTQSFSSPNNLPGNGQNFFEWVQFQDLEA
jgi:hypothetical protein